MDCPNGPSELIENSVNGYIVPLHDYELFESKLKLLMEDKNQRLQFSEKAAKSVEKYKPNEVALKWEKAIASLL